MKKTNKKNKIPYSLSSKPQRYGPGSNRAVINVMKEVSASGTGRFSLQSLLQENQEFVVKRKLFRWFKITEIRATFLPANVTGAFNNIAVLMSWWLTSHVPSEMYQDDATKLVPVYRVKPRTLRFLPPRSVLDVQSIAPNPPNKFFDFSQFLSTDFTTNFPGWLYVYNTSNVTLYFNYEAVVIFRGNDNQSDPSTITQEENPYIDKFFSKEQLEIDQQKIKAKSIIEDDLLQIDDEKPLLPLNSKEYKEERLVYLQKEIEKLKNELAKPQEEQKEEEKKQLREMFQAKIDQEELNDYIKHDLISKKLKPK